MDIKNTLYVAAQKARNQAYAPYSNFKVGAAIYADNSQIYTGCNVENISFPCGTCAEQSAISSMITQGGKQIMQILIIADGENLITPCGACLQRIAEFSNAQTLIHLASLKGIQKSLTISDLLPHRFVAKELKND